MPSKITPAEALNIADNALDLMLRATEGLGAAVALVRGNMRRADKLLHRAAAVQARAGKLEALL